MLISEIFSSIDGESKRAGELATFIRTVGCNLRCSYCDSKYTWSKEDTKEMSVDEIVEECVKLGNTNITFTGGEPLLQKDADKLIKTLCFKGFNVGIETDGGIDFTEREWFKDKLSSQVWVCADYKCPSSGMQDKMIPLSKFAKLRNEDVLKFVVGSKKDLEVAYTVYNILRKNFCYCYIYLSPVFGAIEPVEIVKFMQEKNMQGKVRFQLQLHKFIWDPNMRGV